MKFDEDAKLDADQVDDIRKRGGRRAGGPGGGGLGGGFSLPKGMGMAAGGGLIAIIALVVSLLGGGGGGGLGGLDNVGFNLPGLQPAPGAESSSEVRGADGSDVAKNCQTGRTRTVAMTA